MLDVRLPARPQSARQARRFVEQAMGGRVDGRVLEDLRLLVSELVTNSLRHAGVSGEDAIRLRASARGNVVRVEVCDEGRGFRPGAGVPSLHEDSGWGLFLVGRLSDRWGVRRERGTCVWFEIDLPARGQRVS